MKQRLNRFSRQVALGCMLTALGAGVVLRAHAQLGDREENQRRDLEIRYIQALQETGLHSYADMVIEDLRRDFPGIDAEIKVIELRGMLARGLFDQARERIDREPDPDATATWAMRMALADGLYAYGRYEEAAGVYESFFARFPDGPDAALNTFYRDAAYRYAQMLLYIGQRRPALDAYRRILKAEIVRDERRQIEAEMGELLLRLAEGETDKQKREAYLKEARGIADSLLWIQDVWFGKGIVMLAHIRMFEGDIGAAQDLVETYMPQLRRIDNSVREQASEVGQDLSRISPMAECRYLLGVMLQDEAERLMKEPDFDRDRVLALLVGERDSQGRRRQGGALQHFVNVFVRYADTGWAPEAGERADRIETMLERDFGARIAKSITPEQWARVRRNLFDEARVLFNQNQFGPAIERYLSVLNRFPDTAESIPALSELARCYIEEDEPLYAETVIGHLAERFSRHPEHSNEAGDEVMRIGEFYGQRGMEDRRLATYDRFFDLYPRHPMTPSMLFSFGNRFFRDDRYDDALPYLREVSNVYTNAPLSIDALSLKARIYESTGQSTNELRTLNRYVERLQQRDRPGQTMMSARYRLAQAIRNFGLNLVRSGDAEQVGNGNRYLQTAAVHFERLIEILSDPANPFQASEEDRRRNRDLLAAALFSRGQVLTMLTEPAERIDDFRREAIKAFEEVAREFPDSEHAPRALSQVGTLYTVLKQAEPAQEALRKLRATYPESQEARNALFQLGHNLMEMGLRGEAIPVFRQMFEEGGEYAAAELIRAGQELYAAREYELALEGFDRALTSAENPAVRGPALLGRARVLLALSRFDEAIAATESVMKDFSRTTMALDALLLQSRAAREAGAREADGTTRRRLFRQAADAMKNVAQYRETPAELLAVDLDVGRILARQADAEEQFGTPERLREVRGQAIAAYLQVTLNADPGDSAVAPVLQQAYHESIPLLIALGDWENAFEDARLYLAAFPRGPHVGDIRNWQNQARVELTARGAAPPEN